MALAIVASLLVTQPTAADAEGERTKLFAEGRALAEKGKYAEAAEKFRAVIKLRSAPKALIALAAVEEQQRRFLSALRLYERARLDAIAAKLLEDQQTAEAGIARVDDLLPRLHVRVPPARAASAALAIDGAPVAQPWTAICLDPGVHRVVVELDGRERFRADITLAARDRRVLEVSADEASPVTSTPPPRSPLAWPPLVLGGTGALVGVAGALVLVSGLRDEDARRRECPNDTCPKDTPTDNPGRTKIIVGDVMVIAGGAALVGGAIWFAARYVGSTPSPSSAWRIVPALAPTAIAATLTWTF